MDVSPVSVLSKGILSQQRIGH